MISTLIKACSSHKWPPTHSEAWWRSSSQDRGGWRGRRRRGRGSRLHRLGSRAHSRPAFIRADAGRMAADKPPSPESQVVIAARHCSRAGRCGACSTPQRPGGRAPPVALAACHHEGACVWTHWSIGPLARAAVRAGGRIRGWAVSTGRARDSRGTGRSIRARAALHAAQPPHRATFVTCQACGAGIVLRRTAVADRSHDAPGPTGKRPIPRRGDAITGGW